MGRKPLKAYRSTAHWAWSRPFTQEYRNSSDTVYALSSALGRAGVSVIRISGPKATQVFSSLTSPSTVPSARYATLRKLYSPKERGREQLDEVLCLYFQGPHSFTGEDVVELHVHGSVAVISATLESLSQISFRPADPGEFTRRAFYNGKMDLTSVEGLSDLISAETSAQRRQALWQLNGNKGALFNEWVQLLTRALANIEALIDFGEEEHLDIQIIAEVLPLVKNLRDSISKHLGDGHRGEIVRSGIHVSIVGPPNAGKSSLLNHIAERPAAIVSPIKGTTRDIVEVRMDLGGLPVVMADTAGISDEPSDPIELEGIRRAIERHEISSIKLVVLDIQSILKSYDELCLGSLEPSITNLLIQAKTDLNAHLIINKVDLLPPMSPETSAQLKTKLFALTEIPTSRIHFTSCQDDIGFDTLLEALRMNVVSILGWGESQAGSSSPEGASVITRSRHRYLLNEVVDALNKFLENPSQVEVAAEELRYAIYSLGKITGKVDVEKILEVIFKDFCIGK
uniref:TrmE-type G domain-containing protein n=1 Tax=Arcella intermedia TaxID=1963864 RepID=A0A6B2L1W0_9EUKA